MLTLIPILAIWALSLFGYGRLLLDLPGFHSRLFRHPLDLIGFSGLLGIVVLTTLAGVVTFFAGLGGTPALLFCTLGLCLWFVRRKESPACPPFLWSILLALLVFCAWCGARPILNGDTAGYHMQAVQWIAGQPVVPGLANLHGRFGFNSSWWVFAAALELPGLSGKSAHLANPLLLFFLGAIILAAFHRFTTSKALPADSVLILLLFLWLRQGISWNTPSLGNDTPANLLTAFSLYLLAVSLADRDPAARQLHLSAALAFSAFTLTVKLNAVILLSGCLAAFVFCLARDASMRRALPATAALIATILIPWQARSLAISGYPAYPSTLLRCDFLPWTAPEKQARFDASEIGRWPTRGEKTGENRPAFLRWLDNQIGYGTAIMGAVIALGALAAAAWAFLRFSAGTYYLGSGFLFPSVIALAGIAFVLLTAPAFRFMSGYFFALAGLLLAPVLPLLASRGKAWRMAGLVLFAALSLTANGITAPERGTYWLAIPPLPEPDVREKSTAGGLVIRVPAEDGSAWNTPRPSTPYFNPALKARLAPDGRILSFAP